MFGLLASLAAAAITASQVITAAEVITASATAITAIAVAANTVSDTRSD